jgi:phage terminase large subunit GpA-like protein
MGADRGPEGGLKFVIPGFPWPPPVIEEIHREVFQIPPKLPLSEWAEANIILSPEYSNSTGPLQLFGWQKGIFDAATDPDIETVVLMTSTQVIKSLFMMCAVANWIATDPGPILLVEPKADSAKDFSKRRLAPLARDCPVLHGRLSDSLRDGQNTILGKDFPGGNLLIVSARTPVDLAQHTIRYLVCDEIDKYDQDVGGSAERQGEGDPVDLAWERAMTFGSRRKRLLACSPTVAGLSRIGKAWAISDQRRPYVPCPHCGQMQVLRFRDKDGYHVKWDSSVARELQPATARYHCVKCDKPWTEQQRWTAANHHVEWRAENPSSADRGVAGFWVNHLYVPPTWKTCASITQQFLNAKHDRQQLKTFINTVLAEEWIEEGEAPEKEKLFARREAYSFGELAVVPERGLFLTAAADVQENPPRLEVEIKAWGRGRENWSMGYWILQAFHENGQELPVSSKELWDKLDELLYRDWPHASGHVLPILAICIDTGTNPKPVYEFARRPGHFQLNYGPQGIRLIAQRTIVPVKGNDDNLRIISSISKEDAARKRQGVRIVGIGTHCVKAELFDLLSHALPNPDESPSPGCYHFPLYDMVYFEGLTAEVKLVKSNGDVVYEKRGPRNEPVDLAVYNRGAAAIVGIDRMNEQHWQTFEEALRPMGGPPRPIAATAAPAATLVTPATRPAVTVQPGFARPVRGGFRRE